MSFVEQANAAIRAAGGRFTEQRRLIIELLEQARDHLDAEGLYQQVHRQDSSVSRATVYRTLNVLHESGLIDQRFISRDHTRRYYEPLNTGEHYHFICRNCRRVIEFETMLVQKIRRTLESHLQVEVDHACVCFEGLCSDCKSQESR